MSKNNRFDPEKLKLQTVYACLFYFNPFNGKHMRQKKQISENDTNFFRFSTAYLFFFQVFDERTHAKLKNSTLKTPSNLIIVFKGTFKNTL